MLNDTTLEALCRALEGNPRGLLVVRDELAGWFGSFDRYAAGKGGDRAFWLETYDGGGFTLDRVKHDTPQHIAYTGTCLLGGIEPDRLRSLLLSGDDDGLRTRFLFVCPDRPKRHLPTQAPDDRLIAACLARLESLEMDRDNSGQPVPRILTLSAEARATFETWWLAVPERAPAGRLKGWWGKIEGRTLRLSLVLTLLDWASDARVGRPPEAITGNAMARAIRVMEDYFWPHAQRAFGAPDGQEPDPLVVKLARHLKDARPPDITVRALRRGAFKTDDARGVLTACLALSGHGWLRPAFARQGQTPGRESKRFLVNPALRA